MATKNAGSVPGSKASSGSGSSKGTKGPQGNPLEGEASIPENDGAEGVTTEGGVPNDDESAQQGKPADVEGPLSTPSDSSDPTAPAKYIATDGDVQGDGRSTNDLRDRRVIDPDAPFDYNQLPDDNTVQGNHYPPSEAYFESMKADAQARLDQAEADFVAAGEALDREAQDVPEQPSRTVKAVKDNENVKPA